MEFLFVRLMRQTKWHQNKQTTNRDLCTQNPNSTRIKADAPFRGRQKTRVSARTFRRNYGAERPKDSRLHSPWLREINGGANQIATGANPTQFRSSTASCAVGRRPLDLVY
jgi:hypothetical protein